MQLNFAFASRRGLGLFGKEPGRNARKDVPGRISGWGPLRPEASAQPSGSLAGKHLQFISGSEAMDSVVLALSRIGWLGPRPGGIGRGQRAKTEVGSLEILASSIDPGPQSLLSLGTG